MSDFKQALARIEELQEKVDLRHKRYNSLQDINELITLLRLHADSIVQLAKVAQEMRFYDSWARAVACDSYDKLMKGDE